MSIPPTISAAKQLARLRNATGALTVVSRLNGLADFHRRATAPARAVQGQIDKVLSRIPRNTGGPYV